jgi:hypothetical protein
MTTKAKAALYAANNAALATSCSLSAVLSWLDPVAPEKDDRDPATMLNEQLDRAEASAVIALEKVQRLRELIVERDWREAHGMTSE